MTDSVTITRPIPRSRDKLAHWFPYLFIALLANAGIWVAAVAYLKLKAPTYTSSWAINVPVSGSAARVSLPEIGQTSYDSSSPYSVSTQDPRQNYKFVAESDAVLKAAAAQLNISPEEFGQPKIKLSDSTSIINFQVKGATPEQARNKSFALYRALQARVNELRVQEFVQRDASFQSSLGASQKKLEIAQKRLSEYKAQSGLNSNDQLKALSDNIENLRKQRSEILAQQQQSNARMKQLTSNLNLSEREAADAFALQTDQVFQQNLRNYSEASTNVVALSARFLPDHPSILAEEAKQDAARVAMFSRGQELLGKPLNQTMLQKLNLSGGGGRESLFQELIDVQAENRGLQSQAQETNQQINLLENRLSALSQKETTLEALKRDLQVAEAVFSSTLANLDITRSNAFGSYPLLQMIAEPNLAKVPTSPKKDVALAGASAGSLFITTGILTLWLHQRRKMFLAQEHKPQYRVTEKE
ncbi:MAG TPA: hypothetical protein DEV81_16790 [Cyanobacteria bacterium UBA11049]|nr:hypothetical protein [Cyanobacteria bacterium UBA11049]